MRLIQMDSSPFEGEKNTRGSTTYGDQNEGNQVDGATLPPTPLVV